MRTLWFASLAIGAVLVLVWLMLLPFWQSFATFLNPNDEIVGYSVGALSVLLVPYMLLALNLITDSIFYGIGRTDFMAYQAIVTNGTVYVGAFIAYVTGFWSPTFDSVLLLFGIGIFVDSLLTVYFALKVLFPGGKTADPDPGGSGMSR